MPPPSTTSSWTVLKKAVDKLNYKIKTILTYENDEHFCTISIEDRIISAVKGASPIITLNNAYINALENILKEPTEETSMIRKKHIDRVADKLTIIVNNSSEGSSTSTQPLKKTTLVKDESKAPAEKSTSDSLNITKDQIKDEIMANPKSTLRKNDCDENFGANKISDSNIGYKMMQTLGWSGGPLGANSDGIEEPIKVELKNNRAGLGSDGKKPKAGSNSFGYYQVFEYLKLYANDSGRTSKLTFSDSFSDREKNLLKACSRRLCLTVEHEQSENGELVVTVSKGPRSYKNRFKRNFKKRKI